MWILLLMQALLVILKDRLMNMNDKLLTLKWFLLMLLSIVLFSILSPIMFISQVTFRLFHKDYDLWYYFKSIAIGIDSLGGSVIYGSQLHTISGMSGYFQSLTVYKDNLFKIISITHKKIIAPFIDFFFGKNHCEEIARDEDLIK